jgi:hypothetical protein
LLHARIIGQYRIEELAQIPSEVNLDVELVCDVDKPRNLAKSVTVE